ncbi:cell division protein ZapE [Nocardia seriolae]|nr:cell division protein ZapE [Nocardia seriolae]MTJ70637.1 cell division protein ZapE [Nocardia seriolae]
MSACRAIRWLRRCASRRSSQLAILCASSSGSISSIPGSRAANSVRERVAMRSTMPSISARLNAGINEYGNIGASADALLGDAELICFDEFHVHDSGDALRESGRRALRRRPRAVDLRRCATVRIGRRYRARARSLPHPEPPR